jgi:GNAT superfamily N-acetyltransferase
MALNKGLGSRAATSLPLCDPNSGLWLRAARAGPDIEHLAAFNTLVHRDEGIAAYTRWKLGGGHPAARSSDALIIEDPTGQLVSSLCWIPQTWVYGGISLPVGEVALVGTHPDYRKRGLMSALMCRVEAGLQKRGCALACIEGIPGFYRQFGYEYAVPLGSCAKLTLDRVSQGAVPPHPSWVIRPFRIDQDLPTVMSLYNMSSGILDITSQRDEALWLYQESAPPGVPDRQETYIIEDAGTTVGYFRLRKNMWGPWLEFSEASAGESEAAGDSGDAYRAMLHFARGLAVQRGYVGLCFALPLDHLLLSLVHTLGAEVERQYAWQIKVLDPVSLLKRIAPVLEDRLARSPLGGFDVEMDVNLMSRLLHVAFEGGRLTKVAMEGREARPRVELRLPERQLTQLMLGYRDCRTLMDCSLDVWVHPEIRELVDIVFPTCRAFIYTAS